MQVNYCYKMPKRISELTDRSIRRAVHEDAKYFKEFRLKNKKDLKTFKFKKLPTGTSVVQNNLQTSKQCTSEQLPVLNQDVKNYLQTSKQSMKEKINEMQVNNDFCINSQNNFFAGKLAETAYFYVEQVKDNEKGGRNFVSNKRKLDDQDDEVKQVRNKLCKWAVKHKEKHSSVTSLLTILREHPCFEKFPRHARTMLETPRKSRPIIQMSPGSYVHFGLESGVRCYVNQKKTVESPLKLRIGIDGVPVSKNPELNAWPILCSIYPDGGIFVIGVYHGPSKPESVSDYLSRFINDINNLKNIGIKVNDTVYYGEIMFIICDLVAKTYLLSTTLHSGYFSCFKCKVKGKTLYHRRCFPEINCEKRTDKEMRSKLGENSGTDNRTSLTPLEKIPNLNLIHQIPLDYMHLLCLGVVRALIDYFVFGLRLRKYKVDNKRWTPLQLAQANSYLNGIKNFIPVEFGRKPALLQKCHKWKALNSRLFVGYIGPQVLFRIYEENSDFVKPFLALHVVFRLLSTFKNETEIKRAKDLSVYFIRFMKYLYGEVVVSQNVHNLVHLCDEVLQLGLPLDEFSAFSFENYMRHFKTLIRKNEQPLQQISNRLDEMERHDILGLVKNQKLAYKEKANMRKVPC